MILYRSLLKQLAQSWLVSMLVILAIFMINIVSNQLHYVVSGRIDFSILFELFCVQFIVFANFLVPLSGFVAVLSVLGRLYMANEITVMRACGISQLRLFSVVLFFGLIFALFSMVMSFWVSPIMEAQQSFIMSKAKKIVVTRKVMPKQFNSLDNTKAKIIYASRNDKATATLKKVFIALPPKGDKMVAGRPLANWDIITGQKLKITNIGVKQLPYMVVYHGHRYHYNANGELMVSDFTRHGLLVRALKKQPPPWPQSADIVSLWRYSGAQLQRTEGQLLLRLSVPISLLVLLVVAFGLTKADSRRGRLSFVFPAIVIFALYSNAIFMIQSWVAIGKISLVSGMLWLHGLPLFLGLNLIYWRHDGKLWLKRVFKR